MKEIVKGTDNQMTHHPIALNAGLQNTPNEKEVDLSQKGLNYILLWDWH